MGITVASLALIFGIAGGGLEDRMVPAYQDRRVIGLKIFPGGRDCVLRCAGFRSGDIIRSINGREVTSPERLRAAREAARDAERLSVVVQRRGETVLIENDLSLGRPSTRDRDAALEAMFARCLEEDVAPECTAADRLRMGCTRLWPDPREKNHALLLVAGQSCIDGVLLDVYGGRIRLRVEGAHVVAWSSGADGAPNTAADEVTEVENGSCRPASDQR